MFVDVYIGYAYSEKFNYDLGKYDKSGYLPEPALHNAVNEASKHFFGERDLYWAIWHHPKGKQVDWGCCVIKMYPKEMIEFLSQKELRSLAICKYLSLCADVFLKDDVEYVIAAVES